MRRVPLLIFTVLVCVSVSVLLESSEDVAAEGDQSGKCGDDVRYVFSSGDGVLTISGSGNMYDYYPETIPWYSYKDDIESVKVTGTVESIGDYAFYNCTHLGSVDFGESVSTIGSRAFENCTSLTTVDIPCTLKDDVFKGCTSLSSVTLDGSIESIGEYAFEKCSSLVSVTLPDSLKNIAAGLFLDCTSLVDVNIPENVRSIGNTAFSNCTSLASVTVSGSVETINYEAYLNCTSLRSVIILGSNTSIGKYVFSDCTGLTELSVPISVNCAGTDGSAFSDCVNLQKITFTAGTGEWNPGNSSDNVPWKFSKSVLATVVIEDGVKFIPDSMFKDFTALAALVLPDTVTSIGSRAFENCTSLTTVDIPCTLKDHVFHGCTSLSSVTIADSVKSIGEYAFEGCTSIKSLTLPDSLETIANGLFHDCTALADLTIPKNVKSIGSCAFENCTGLTAIEAFGTLADYVFKGCTSLSSVTLDGSIESIGEYTFESCTSLVSVTLPDSLENIAAGLFLDCTSLVDVNIPENVKSIGSSAFENCISLTAIDIPCTLKDHVFKGCTSLSSVTLDGSIESIGEYAFEKCSSLVSVTLPDSLENIAAGLFLDCTSLVDVNIPENVRSIGDIAFSNCTSLASVTVSASVETINYEAYLNCTSLRSVIILGSNTSIGGCVFSNCTGLNELSVPISVNCAGTDGSAFSDCVNLQKITFTAGTGEWNPGNSSDNVPWKLSKSVLNTVVIEEGVKSTGISTFKDSIGLKTLCLWVGFNSVGSNYAPVFSGCTAIEKITFTGSGEWFAYDLNESNGYYYRYTPWQITEADLTVAIADDTTTVGDYALYDCPKLVYLHIPESVGSIGDYAFRGCTSLSSLTISGTFESIGKSVFRDCTGLKSLTVPAGMDCVGSNAAPMFSGCTNIETMTFIGSGSWYAYGEHAFDESYYGFTPWQLSKAVLRTVIISDGVGSVGDYAFKGCATLASIVIPDSVTSIGNEAFSYCSSLTSAGIGKSLPRIGDKVFANCSSLSSVIMWEATSVSDSAFENCGHIEFVIKPVYYTITFMSDDQVIQTLEVRYNTLPEYTGNTPTKEATAQYTYTFKGWSPEIVKATGNAIYVAEFTETLREYTITFKNGDKTLQQTQVPYGTVPEYVGTEPTKEATAQYTFKFKGWDSEIVAVTGDATYTAVFDEIVNRYTIRFMNDGTELLTLSVEYGTVPEYKGQTPTKEATAEHSYKFSGWNPAIVKVTGNATYVAEFTETLREYTITFMNGDETLQQTQVPYGTVPEYAGETPTKTESDLYTYIFVGWDSMIVPVVGDATYTADFVGYSKDVRTAVIEAGDCDSVTVSKDAMDWINTDLAKGTIESLTVKLSTGSIVLGPQAASGIKGGSTFSIIREIHPVIPSGAQKLIGDRPVYDITITSADGSIHQFDGDLTISVKYELRDGEDAKDICIVYLKDDGTYSTVDATYSDGYVTFAADHLSSYAVAFNGADIHPADTGTDITILGVITAIILLAVSAVCWRYWVRKYRNDLSS